MLRNDRRLKAYALRSNFPSCLVKGFVCLQPIAVCASDLMGHACMSYALLLSERSLMNKWKLIGHIMIAWKLESKFWQGKEASLHPHPLHTHHQTPGCPAERFLLENAYAYSIKHFLQASNDILQLLRQLWHTQSLSAQDCLACGQQKASRAW